MKEALHTVYSSELLIYILKLPAQGGIEERQALKACFIDEEQNFRRLRVRFRIILRGYLLFWI